VDIHYYDDPVDEPVVKRKKPRALFGVLLLLAGGFYLNTTLAANINISTGGKVEFGQGIAMTTACSGSTALTVTPRSSFVNASGSGSFYFNSVTVSGIPAGCNGLDFAISAYDSTTSTALPIFGTNKTVARIWNDGGTFKLGAGSIIGASITSSSGAFTISFTSPVALAANVSRITLESLSHINASCIEGGVCTLGETGPGGGKVFYVNLSGFNCGPTLALTCNYLEFAPASWNSSDGFFNFATAANKNTSVNPANGITADTNPNNTITGIGLGFINSNNIVAQGNGLTTAAGKARAYTGGGLNDWYLPTYGEITQLCKYVSGQVGTPDSTRCAGIASSVFGLATGSYWTSSERNSGNAWLLNFNPTYSIADYTQVKDANINVRPIRAF
jgi:hypothetical protein